MSFNKEIKLPKEPSEYVQSYNDAVFLIHQAYDKLTQVKNILQNDIGFHSIDALPIPKNYGEVKDIKEKVLKDLKINMWLQIVSLMQIEKIMSKSRLDKLYQNISDGKTVEGKELPDVTVEEIVRLRESLLQNVNKYLYESMKNVFGYLTPGRNHYDKYETNKAHISEKVVLQFVFETSFGFTRTNYNKIGNLVELDKIFHILDGSTDIFLGGGYRSVLVDQIEDSVRHCIKEGETEYFRWKGYKNGNLHLWIKRMDLAEKLTQYVADRDLEES